MEQKVSFDYFYGTQADQYSFYRIPKALFQNDYFKNLSSDAKILYGLMLDRMSLSIKNQWFDEQNRAYIYFSRYDERICERQAFVLERRMNMAYIHEILGKSNIRGVADYLLFGLGPDEDDRSYEERLDEFI